MSGGAFEMVKIVMANSRSKEAIISLFTYQQVSNLLYGITCKDLTIHIIFIYPKLPDDLLSFFSFFMCCVLYVLYIFLVVNAKLETESKLTVEIGTKVQDLYNISFN